MSNIPADRPFKQPPLVEETKPNPTDSEASKVAQKRLTPTSDSTRSTAPLDINPNTDPSKTTETTHQVAASILCPRSIGQLRKLAIVKPNLEKSLRELDIVSFLKTLKPPFPSREVFQRMIKQIKNADTLLEIWSELLLKPEDDSLEDLLVDVFQAIYQKNRDSSFTAYTKTGQRIKLEKRIADCIKPEDSEFFLDKAIDKNAHFSIILFFKKFYEKKVSEGNKSDLYRKFTSTYLGDRICLQLSFLIEVYPTGFRTITLGDFQHLYVDFFEAGWGTKEEFLTKALCCFWNEITSSNSEKIKIDLEDLENGILDIGVEHNPTLSSGNRPLFVLLFFVGILYPTIQEKIRARGTSSFQVEPSELERDYAKLDPDPKRFIDKICTLLLPPEEAIKNLEEVDLSNTKSFPCIRTKHQQFSGSCTVKNLNSLLSMSSLAPSIIMKGGYNDHVVHVVYAEVFRLGNQYFALVHNLGGGSEIHRQDRKKIIPLALHFKDKELLIQFSKTFCHEGTTEEEYLGLVQDYALNSGGAWFKRLSEFPERLWYFVASLGAIDEDRTNPLHTKYREFRKLQKEIIRKLIDHTGSPSEVKRKASDVRKIQKGQARGGQ